MNLLFQALSNAADGAFVINQEQHIIFWNKTAQDYLGRSPDEVLNKPCYEILAGCNGQKQSVCHEHCLAAAKALNGESVLNYDICVRTKSNGLRWLNMSTITFPTNSDNKDLVLVHLFRDVTQQKRKEQFVDQVLEAANNLQMRPSSLAHSGMPEESPDPALTDREHEVLALLAQGHSTQLIARTLSISTSTVRNHVRNILQKLQVHNRLEAVVYALRNGLVAKR